ncbi:hypothetical protein, partial [Acinetobacter baumannii]|uniref:hypothetical protein n=1 Tax=Acinetobacter baumannii TaxID=470 RepID=UPI00289358AD
YLDFKDKIKVGSILYEKLNKPFNLDISSKSILELMYLNIKDLIYLLRARPNDIFLSLVIVTPVTWRL